MRGDISEIRITGNLGSTNAPTDVIYMLAGKIDTLVVGGDVVDRIVLRPTTSSGVGPQAKIGTMTVTGAINIPLASGIPSILCREGIGTLSAASISGYIQANFDATVSNNQGPGTIGRLETTSGGASGAIVAKGLQRVNSSSGLFIAGDVSGTINFGTSGIKAPIDISGSITSTGVIVTSDGILDDASSDGRVSVDGTVDGRIIVGGTLGGAVSINTLGGLAGQIILNASNSSGTWDSTVTVGGPVAPQIVLGPSESAPRTSPYYGVLSSQLGGGAVGLVPFHLHDTSCDPANNPTTPGTLVITALPTTPITATLYGPVRTNATTTDTDQPIIFEKQLISGYEDETEKVSIAMKRGGDTGWSRQILITQKSDTTLMPGIYRIRPRLTGASRLFCDQLNLTTPPSVADFEYWVNILEDCNSNGIADVDDIAAHPWWDDWGLDGGLGANGRLDQCEWTGCPAVVDFNGFVNGDDFDVFSEWFEAADGDADFNYDGFVNGDDYDLFAAAFNGAC